MSTETRQILTQVGLYTDVIGVITSFLLPSKEEIDKDRYHTYQSLNRLFLSIPIQINSIETCLYPSAFNERRLTRGMSRIEIILLDILGTSCLTVNQLKQGFKRLSNDNQRYLLEYVDNLYKSIKYDVDVDTNEFDSNNDLFVRNYGRMQSGLSKMVYILKNRHALRETNTSKSAKRCSVCNREGHNKRTCPNK